VPARVADVVVELVVAVPAEHDIAEAEAAREGALELVAGHVLAAQHPVHVENAHLDMGQIALFHDLPRVSVVLHLIGLEHPFPPRSGT
jgi:hypothetical protein